jgi:hypothetical protein
MSCCGGVRPSGSGGVVRPDRLAARAALRRTSGSCAPNGRASAWLKSNAPSRSPQTARRQAGNAAGGHPEAGFEQADHRGVVIHLAVDPAAAAPWRDHIHRYPRAQPVGAAEQVIALVALVAGRVLPVVLPAGVHHRLSGPAAGPLWVGRGRCRRRHVVEEAVVLVEHDQQRGLAPDFRVGGQRVEQAGGVGRALHRAGRAGMLAAGGIGNDEAHLRQAVGQHVGAQGIQGVGADPALAQLLIMPGLALPGRAESLEAGQRVVGEVVGHVLVDAPVHPGLLQLFDIGHPAVAVRMTAVFGEVVVRVGDRRAAVTARRIIVATPQEQPVRIGAALEGAVVGIAHGEGVGQGELERQVVTPEVTHRMVLLVPRPLRHAPVVPGVLGIGPAVRGAFHPHVVKLAGGVQRERGQHAVTLLAGLQPHRALGVPRQGRGGNNEPVTETTYPGQAAEVVVEGTVFLHEDHHMLQVLQRA